MWTYECDTTNSIAITKDGMPTLQIIHDHRDIDQEDIEFAKKVCDALNKENI